MRRTERYPVQRVNSLWQLYRTVPFPKVFRNVLVAEIGRFMPFFPLKNVLYRRFLGMEIGHETAFAYKVMVDLLYPERIRIGANSILGYNTTILTHEYLVEEYRLGDVEIGNSVMVGANTTILPGVRIGDGAVIGAGSLVNRDIPAGVLAAGNPVRIIRERK
ncbi:acetyltransferase-like isoleucine patch superfamily enzyme [Melghirimyces profundicolus]|uniref:Acetyltransferase-like isoleucine patch superfamily enzyme n=1 Tax=Melghirimyces profundicolus TaxID=1242148 RepID=A0A2T6BUA4_9BACL|nr:acyltransferase [Melghirimyces profundicolus]PTX59643.1 acetyltransferase-like isoleucine patch superfamily enzyme [Melghirimyces profundicolus]